MEDPRKKSINSRHPLTTILFIKAIELGADYVLPIKENQTGLLEEVELLFREAHDKKFQGIDADDFETLNDIHERHII